MNYHRFSGKKKSKLFSKFKPHFYCIFVKTGSNPKHFITKMINVKFSTNLESFDGLDRGRRKSLRFPMDIAINNSHF